MSIATALSRAPLSLKRRQNSCNALAVTALFHPDDPAKFSRSMTKADVFRCPPQIEFVNRDRANLAVTDAPVVLFQPSSAPRFKRCPNSGKANRQYRPGS